jgi:DNA mismatch endonuclease (patch repair protein)
MADVVDREMRSRMMASIVPADTEPELAARRYLHATGLRFMIVACPVGPKDLLFIEYDHLSPRE